MIGELSRSMAWRFAFVLGLFVVFVAADVIQAAVYMPPDICNGTEPWWVKALAGCWF